MKPLAQSLVVASNDNNFITSLTVLLICSFSSNLLQNFQLALDVHVQYVILLRSFRFVCLLESLYLDNFN